MDKEKIIISYFKLNEKERQERYIATNGMAFLKKGLIAVGYTHFVTLQDDGTVAAFGNNEYGQCDVDNWCNVIKVAAGDFHTAALKSDGTSEQLPDMYAAAEMQIPSQRDEAREFEFHITDNCVVIDKYLGDSPSVVIPSHIQGFPVEIIGASAFELSKLKRVVLPSTLKKIEARTFAYCKHLEDVQIPAGLEQIGSYAFLHCSALCTLTLPSSVKSIGTRIFLGCVNLKKLTIPKRCKIAILSHITDINSTSIKFI